MITSFPHPLILDPLLTQWLQEDWGRGDRATQALFGRDTPLAQGTFLLKEAGVIAGLPLIERIYHLIDERVECHLKGSEGTA